MADYTPSVSPYSVPNATDPPDVPTHMRNFASRMTSHGFRTRWNQGVYTEGTTVGQSTLAPGFDGTVAAVAATGMDGQTYFPRGIAFIWGFAVCTTLDNAAGYIGVTNNIASGSWVSKIRWHNNDAPDALFTLPVFATHYFNPANQVGYSLHAQVDSGGVSLIIQEAQINAQYYPINQ